MNKHGGQAGQTGRSTLGGLLALVVIAAGIYVGMKLVPVRAAAFALNDVVREQTILAAGNRRVTDTRVRSRILEVAEARGLPVTERDVRIVREERLGRRQREETIRVEVAYTVPIEFVGGHVYRWDFEHDYEAPVIR